MDMDYIEDYMADKISQAAFWELVKFKYPTHQIVDDDLYFACYMIEWVARKLYPKNKYVVNGIAKEEWKRLISLANVSHCENTLKIEI